MTKRVIVNPPADVDPESTYDPTDYAPAPSTGKRGTQSAAVTLLDALRKRG